MTKSTPSLTTASVNQSLANPSTFASEMSLRKKSLEILVAILHSLVQWANHGFELEEQQTTDFTPTQVLEDATSEGSRTPTSTVVTESFFSLTQPPPPPAIQDDPEQFHNQNYKKKMLQEGIRMFSWKPKRVIFCMSKFLS